MTKERTVIKRILTESLIFFSEPKKSIKNKTTIEFPNPKFDSYTLIITNISGTTVKIIENIKTGKIIRFIAQNIIKLERFWSCFQSFLDNIF